MVLFSSFQKNFYFLGSLFFGSLINLLSIWFLFFNPMSDIFLRGNSPWDFYVANVLATLTALATSLVFDKHENPGKRARLVVALKTYLIFFIGSISLNILTHFFIGINNGLYFFETLKNIVGDLRNLAIFLLTGIPVCIVLGLIYFEMEKFVFQKIMSLKNKF